MARLSVALFGSFQVVLEGEPVRFESDKVRALLAYLVVEARGPHRREKLAGLLWPGWSEASARNNLRHTLAVLRKSIGDRAEQPPGHWTSPGRRSSSVPPSDVSADVTAFVRAPPSREASRRASHPPGGSKPSTSTRVTFSRISPCPTARNSKNGRCSAASSSAARPWIPSTAWLRTWPSAASTSAP